VFYNGARSNSPRGTSWSVPTCEEGTPQLGTVAQTSSLLYRGLLARFNVETFNQLPKVTMKRKLLLHPLTFPNSQRKTLVEAET